jgi:hypothetical protein
MQIYLYQQITDLPNMDEAHGHHDDFPTLSIDEHKNDHTAEACYSDEPNMSFGTTTVTGIQSQT